jgi:hypothetical protein
MLQQTQRDKLAYCRSHHESQTGTVQDQLYLLPSLLQRNGLCYRLPVCRPRNCGTITEAVRELTTIRVQHR